MLLAAVTLTSATCQAAAGDGAGGEQEKPVEVVAIIERDQQGAHLRNPSYVFQDRTTDETYVLNAGKNTIVIYDRSHLPVASLGAGRGVTGPESLFITDDGLVYVAQRKGVKTPGKITVLNGALFAVREIHFRGFEGASDFSPLRLAVTRSKNILAIGTPNTRVVILGPDGDFIRWLYPADRVPRKSSPAEAGGQDMNADKGRNKSAEEGENIAEEFLKALPAELLPTAKKNLAALKKKRSGPQPIQVNDVALDKDGNIYLVSSQMGKVYVHGPDGRFRFAFGEKGGSEGKMSRPRGVAIDDARGVVYVVDYMRHTILAFNKAGKYMFEFGGRGTAPGWFNFPTSIAVSDQGLLVVADYFNNRVQVLRVRLAVASTLYGGKGVEEKKPTSPEPAPAQEKPESNPEKKQPNLPGDS